MNEYNDDENNERKKKQHQQTTAKNIYFMSVWHSHSLCRCFISRNVILIDVI